MRMSGVVRREEVESWSQLASLIPPGQQLHTLQAAYGEGGGRARASSLVEPDPEFLSNLDRDPWFIGYDTILDEKVKSCYVGKNSCKVSSFKENNGT